MTATPSNSPATATDTTITLNGPALYLVVARIQPHRHDLTSGLCVGRAPTFDAGRARGETTAEHQHRLAHAAHLCSKCPVLKTCRDNIPDDAVGIWAGELYDYKTAPKKAA